MITRPIGDTIALCPPLVISEDEINEMFDKISIGLNQALELAAARNLL